MRPAWVRPAALALVQGAVDLLKDDHRVARRVKTDAQSEHGSRWILMTDPEGYEFCVCDGGIGGNAAGSGDG